MSARSDVTTYASSKGAKAAAGKAGCTTPLIVEVNGRYRWSAAKSAPVRTAAAVKGKVQREEKNGVKRPAAGGLCAAVWEYLDNHGNQTPAELRPVAEAKGWNQNNTSLELYAWRKFNGITRAAKR